MIMKEWFDLIPVDEMIEWRHHIHQNPELSFEEYQTAQYVEDHLKYVKEYKDERDRLNKEKEN